MLSSDSLKIMPINFGGYGEHFVKFQVSSLVWEWLKSDMFGVTVLITDNIFIELGGTRGTKLV